MYRFDWAVLVTDTLLGELISAAGDSGAPDDALRAAVARVLGHVGGLPVVDQPLATDARTAWARRLLHEALLHAIRDPGRTSDRDDGYVAKPLASIPDADEVARAVERVGINSAPIEQLRAAGLGEAVALRLVEERQTHGRIASLQDMDERVRGVGPATVREIAHAVRFDRPSATGPAGFAAPMEPIGAGGFAADFAFLVAGRPGATTRERLLSALDLLATTASTDPHPSTRQMRARRPVPPPPGDGVAADWVGVLSGSDYYHRLPVLFERATVSIDVCMFHIAAPDHGHPTYRLLDALVEAHDRGVAVRVMMDQDRETDPYLSTVINSPARAFLEGRGVPCRFDASEVLLHSKFVLVDGTLAVVGSHNWSAGSYFQFDDLSLVVKAPAFVQGMVARFESLWQHGA